MILTITSYSFNASGKQVTLSGYGSISIEGLHYVKNLTTGQVIFNAIDTLNYGGSVSGNVLTFTASNSGMSNTDKLLIKYDDTAYVQSVSVSGGATAANQATQTTALNQLHSDLIAPLPAGTNTIGSVNVLGGNATAVKVDGSSVTQPVSATSLPLPTGAATAANQSTEITALNQLHSDLIAPLPAGTNNIGTVNVQGGNSTAVKVDGSGVTQPISAASLPLPTGAATSANLTTLGSQTTKINDGTNTAAVKAASTAAVATDPALVVAVSPNNTVPISGTVTVQQATASNLKVDLSGTGANTTALKVDGSGVTQPVSATSLPLPTGAATAANQSTEITALNQLHTDLIAALPAGSNTIGSVNVLGGNSTAVKVDGSGVTQPVSGTFWQATQPVSGTLSANQSGTWTVQPGNTQNTTPWLIRPSDGTNSVAIKAASTAAATTDPALVVAVSPNNTIASTQSGTWTVQPGNTANTTPWLAKISDGTNAATIKAASTAAATTDPALVVAVSPNNTIASTQSGTWTVQPGNTANTTPWLAKISDGTNAATIKAASTAAVAADPALVVAVSPNNTVNIQEVEQYITGQSAQTATVNNIIPAASGSSATDATGYNSFSCQVVSTGTAGTFIFEGSNDNTNFQAITVYNQTLTNPVPIQAAITATSSQIVYVGAITARYIRLRIASTITGGSIQAFTFLKQAPFTSGTMLVAQGSASNMQVTATQSGTWNVGTVTTLSQFASSAAAADATANPTSTITRDALHLFNSSTWDRQYNNYNTTTGDTGTKTASFSGATQTNYNARGAYITVLCGTVSGTSPTLNAQLQWSPDAGTTWINIGSASGNATATGNTIVFQVGALNWSVAGATPAALTTGGTVTVQLNALLPRTWRLNYTVGGTTPSFAITGVYVNYIN
jgi:hypothetical protein